MYFRGKHTTITQQQQQHTYLWCVWEVVVGWVVCCVVGWDGEWVCMCVCVCVPYPHPDPNPHSP